MPQAVGSVPRCSPVAPLELHPRSRTASSHILLDLNQRLANHIQIGIGNGTRKGDGLAERIKLTSALHQLPVRLGTELAVDFIVSALVRVHRVYLLMSRCRRTIYHPRRIFAESLADSLVKIGCRQLLCITAIPIRFLPVYCFSSFLAPVVPVD